MIFIKVLIVSFIITLIATPFFAWVAKRNQIVDRPDKIRKKHGRVVPYLGGLGILLALIVTMSMFMEISPKILTIMIGVIAIAFLGFVDDLYNIKPWQKLCGQLLIGVFLVLSGIGVNLLNLPFGVVFDFSSWDVSWAIGGYSLDVNILSALITIFWTVLLVNSVNFLDGMDGLAGGVSLISFVIIFFLSITSYVHQYDSALLAVIMVGACLGFLFYNLPPASIFLGDTGSMLLGFMLAVMSIISGSKMATVSLVLGVVLLDVLFVIYGRMKHGKKIWDGDMSHLHHKLLDRGWGIWSILGLYMVVSLILGLLALYIPSGVGKLSLGVLLLILFVIFTVRYLERRKK